MTVSWSSIDLILFSIDPACSSRARPLEWISFSFLSSLFTFLYSQSRVSRWRSSQSPHFLFFKKEALPIARMWFSFIYLKILFQQFLSHSSCLFTKVSRVKRVKGQEPPLSWHLIVYVFCLCTGHDVTYGHVTASFSMNGPHCLNIKWMGNHLFWKGI